MKEHTKSEYLQFCANIILGYKGLDFKLSFQVHVSG